MSKKNEPSNSVNPSIRRRTTSGRHETRTRLVSFPASLLCIRPIVCMDQGSPAPLAGEPWSIETIGLMHNREAGNDTSLVRVSWRPEVVRLRMEGLTELLGSFFLDMTYHGHAPHPSPLPIIVQIYLATQITSRPGEPVLFEVGRPGSNVYLSGIVQGRSEEHTSELQSPMYL